ncbi:MAG: serine hydrolase, partial [Rhodobacteraceae bacterium]|nr:serine hydrolase [Paracoccaceae bacterium]
VLPDFRQYDPAAWERQVTIRQCLGHQTPFTAVAPLYTFGADPDRLRAFVMQNAWTKGKPVYSDINFILLGIALERIGGRRIREMDPGDGFSFTPPVDLSVATENCPWRGYVLRGEVHDENCFALRGSGHAGLFGTAEAVLDFAVALLRRDQSGDTHTRLLRSPLSSTRCHGWELPHDGWSGGTACSAKTIGHTGFTGTGLWIDFTAGHAWTLLTNHVHPSRHANSGISELRRAVGTMLFSGD